MDMKLAILFLIGIAKIIKDEVKDTGMVFRYGGERICGYNV
jgi:GGDEF domain-containing protein